MKTVHDKASGESVIRAEGPGGMPVLLVPKRGLAEKVALLAADYGSSDLAGDPPGIAHFLEHTLFETPQGNASDLFSTRGAYSNAYTDYGITAYHVSAPDRFGENLDLLLDFTLNPPFPPEKVEKERGIILQELSMYRDSPGSRLSENLHRALYRRHPVRIDIGGTPTSVRAIRRDQLVANHRAWYAPGNLCLAAVGDLSMEDLLRAVRRHVPRDGRGRPRHVLPPEPRLPVRKRIYARLEVAQPQMLLGFKDPHPPKPGQEALKRRVSAGFCLSLLFDRTADLYQALYDAGLVDEDFSAGYAADRGFAYAAVGGKTKDPEALRKRILEGIARARFTEESLERSRRRARGSYLRIFDRPEALASALVSAEFSHLSLFDFLPALNACRMPEVEAHLHELLLEKQSAMSVVWPR